MAQKSPKSRSLSQKNPETKRCGRCKQVKSVEEFSPRNRRCKVCRNKPPKKYRYTTLVATHRRRWNTPPLTREQYFELIDPNSCEYCGGELPKHGSGIDRKDSRKGYEHGNCVPCCSTCNGLKGRLPHWVFVLVWTHLIARYPHLSQLRNPWEDPKISWMVRKERR